MSEGVFNPTPTVEVLYNNHPILGEGPFFEPESNQLLWVDIEGCTINFLNIDSAINRSIKMPNKVSAVIPVEGSENLLATIGRDICIIDRENGKILEVLKTVDEDKPDNRINDAKCDVNGRLWAGTMGNEQGPDGLKMKAAGTLYNYAKGSLASCVPDVTISNGLGWSTDNKTMYYIDSIPRHVYSFEYNIATGGISDRKVFIDFAKHGTFGTIGLPDGMCTDIYGRLYVACFSGGCVTCWDPSGDLLTRIECPGARTVTSCCFGGPNNSWLFITSGTYAVKDLAAQPNAGAIFVVKDLGTSGPPGSKFKHSN